MENNLVGLLVVTYGDRVSLLELSLSSAYDEGVRNFYILANGVSSNVRDRMERLCDSYTKNSKSRITLFFSSTNSGSAGGFSQLIQSVRLDPFSPQYLLFLDDDNVLLPGAVDSLISTSKLYGVPVMAYRKSRKWQTDALSRGFGYPQFSGQFFGYDFRGRFLKATFRLRKKFEQSCSIDHQNPIIHFGPWGGLLVTRDIIKSLDPPNSQLVLYQDDYEYTSRLSEEYGLRLVSKALLVEVDQSWNNDSSIGIVRPGQIGLICFAHPDFRLFYSARNAIYFDFRRSGLSMFFAFFINFVVFSLQLFVCCLAHCKVRNFVIFEYAVFCGIFGILGESSFFKLRSAEIDD